MTPILQLLLELAILIAAAKVAGYVATRLKQPSVLGQLLVGLALGPSLIGLFEWRILDSALSHEVILDLAEIGVIFLMFVAGLEVDIEDMLKTGRVAILAGTLGVIIPILMGAGSALLFGNTLPASIFIGLILSATSVSISAQTLLELNVLRSKEGLALLGAAVADDVLAILALSIFLAVGAGSAGASGNAAGDIAIVIARMALYFASAVGIGLFILPRLTDLVHRLRISEGVAALAIVVMLLYALSAEVVGQLAAITGAFLAGVMFGRTRHREEIEQGMHTLSYAFFVPLFLVSIGLEADVRSLAGSGVVFAVVIVLVAIVSKLIGCGLGARLGGMSWPQAGRVGLGMISRGEVGLIVATVGLRRGLIDETVFVSVVIMVLATTLVTPFLLRWAFARRAVESREVPYVAESARTGDG
ncbi:MAG: cation:proton antiporter [Anaerolineae bacterium]